jgi:ribonuclease HI
MAKFRRKRDPRERELERLQKLERRRIEEETMDDIQLTELYRRRRRKKYIYNPLMDQCLLFKPEQPDPKVELRKGPDTKGERRKGPDTKGERRKGPDPKVKLREAVDNALERLSAKNRRARTGTVDNFYEYLRGVFHLSNQFAQHPKAGRIARSLDRKADPDVLEASWFFSRLLLRTSKLAPRFRSKYAAALTYAAAKHVEPEELSEFMREKGGINECVDRLQAMRRRRKAPSEGGRKSVSRATIYTEGACLGNPGPGGWAAIVLQNGKERIVQGCRRRTTNSHMELTAAIRGLEALPPGTTAAIVFSDSEYLVRGMNEWLANWKASGRLAFRSDANADLWRSLDTLVQNRQVEWRRVRGRNSDELNERADTLARAQARLAAAKRCKLIGKGTRTVTLQGGL